MLNYKEGTTVFPHRKNVMDYKGNCVIAFYGARITTFNGYIDDHLNVFIVIPTHGGVNLQLVNDSAKYTIYPG